MTKILCLSISFLLFSFSAFGQLVQVNQSSEGSHDDDDGQIGFPYISLKSSTPESTSSTCEDTYGFLPCTTSAWGNVFLIAVYRYLMFIADEFISEGSELLLEILGPGIIGGFVLPVLKLLPDALIVLASGLYGTTEVAQSQVSIGMGLLAGSNVFLLTIVWGACAFFGKCDLDDQNNAIEGTDSKRMNLNRSGVSTDKETKTTAIIMTLSVAPYVVVQIAQMLFGTSSALLSGLIVSSFLFISYTIYQVASPVMQKRQMQYAKHKKLILGFLGHLQTHALGMLLNDDGQLNIESAVKVFRMLDENNDNQLSKGELAAFVAGMELRDDDFADDDFAEKLIHEFDLQGNSHIDLNEFICGLRKWIKKMDDVDGEDPSSSPNDDEIRETYTLRAVGLILLGSTVAVIVSVPMVDVVSNFSIATGIPSFFVSFVVFPLLSSSEAVFGISFARRKTKKSISLTFSMIYGTITMSNVLTLSVFLCLVYLRELTWEFLAQVLVILIVCLIMGGLGSFLTTLPIWTAVLAVVLYPLSLALVYVLVYLCDWS